MLPRIKKTLFSDSAKTVFWGTLSALSGDRYRPPFSGHWLFHWFSAGSTIATACWLGYLPTWSPSLGSKSCITAGLWNPPLGTHHGRACQSSLASCPTAHPLQSCRTHLYRAVKAVHLRICRPTSPESLTYHLDRDSAHLISTNW